MLTIRIRERKGRGGGGGEREALKYIIFTLFVKRILSKLRINLQAGLTDAENREL